MTAVTTHLTLAEAKISSAGQQLRFALKRAKQLKLAPSFLDAINKAIADNQATWIHVGNIAGVLKTRGRPHRRLRHESHP